MRLGEILVARRLLEPEDVERALQIIERRCISCHAAKPSNPSFPEPPSARDSM